ncbi:golgin candidate 5 [Asparagus officinalis]|uniref:golgin candidate 5 n=1 Tax=Asparagus officinalis TaxID=4686 RepID=UPI00098E60C2|nr:golgin candidate 5 [Asparagus officinalis]
MAWFGNVSLGNFPDLAGAVNKLSESVKNIEKNFDTALGLEEKPAGSEGSDTKTLFKPVMAFMGPRADNATPETSGKEETLENSSTATKEQYTSSLEVPSVPTEEVVLTLEKESGDSKIEEKDNNNLDVAGMKPNIPIELDEGKDEAESDPIQVDRDLTIAENVNTEDSPVPPQRKEVTETETGDESQSSIFNLTGLEGGDQVESNIVSVPDEPHNVSDSEVSHDKLDQESEEHPDKASTVHHEVQDSEHVRLDTESSVVNESDAPQSGKIAEVSDEQFTSPTNDEPVPERDANFVKHGIDASSESLEMNAHRKDLESDSNEQSITADSTAELEKVRKELKFMEAALQGAARQSQSKADEIARLMNENEQLKSTIEDLKRKSSEAEIDALREEYHQRVGALERKVYALTRERDTLRREQSKKSDATALLKEKDEIISQVMAEGEELSKKQAAQESTIRKLRAQIREFEEEKQRLNSKLQVEETKVESLKKDKAATEKLLQETIEKNQAELAAQKEFYTNALNAAKEAEAVAEARANNEARAELETRLKEASERESMLVQTLEELRQTLSRTEQQAVFREDMLRRDIDDLQKRYQASELRYNELVAEVPDSTRPLLRQIEAMQETASRRAEAWAGVERALNSRLQEAEAKAAAAEENERVMNERLSQSLSRITVLETQIACLRTEQTQLSRSLEKERQRASESRQEYLATMEEAATQEGRAKQLEDEIKDLRSKHKRVLQEEMAKTELLEKVMFVRTMLFVFQSLVTPMHMIEFSCRSSKLLSDKAFLRGSAHKYRKVKDGWLLSSKHTSLQMFQPSNYGYSKFLLFVALRRKQELKSDFYAEFGYQFQENLDIGRSDLLFDGVGIYEAKISRHELTASHKISRVTSQDHITKLKHPPLENGNVQRQLSSAGSMEESHFLQASLDSSDSFLSERRGSGEFTMSPYFLKSMTPSAFEAALRQKDGELASYVSRLSSLESIRDSLSEELVNMTEQCEKLRAEAAVLPGIRAELEALRRRHSSALELMGERDEALEELRNDIADLKEMYREQVDLLVNKIQVLSSSAGAA